MKKFVFLAVILAVVLTSSCVGNKKAAILFSETPITQPEKIEHLNLKPVFNVRQRVYWVLLSEEAIESDILRMQVIRTDMKYPYYKLEIQYAKDIQRGENKHYLTDYFVLHKDGRYFLKIFSPENYEKPIAEAEFFIDKL